jgi:riboflavin synthase alpha subunit
MAETLGRTTLGGLAVGARVNVERALRLGDELGGHHVAGHVDTVGTIDALRTSPNNREVFVRFPDAQVRLHTSRHTGRKRTHTLAHTYTERERESDTHAHTQRA